MKHFNVYTGRGHAGHSTAYLWEDKQRQHTAHAFESVAKQTFNNASLIPAGSSLLHFPTRDDATYKGL
jgi:hypothetical protein